MNKILIVIGLFYINILFAQVAIGKDQLTTLSNNVTPNPSISLEFGVGFKGIVLPWVVSETGITGAVPGTLMYDISDHKIKVKLASTWKDLSNNTVGAADTTLQDLLNDEPLAKAVIGANATSNTTPGILVLADNNKAMILPKMVSPHANIKNPTAGTIAYDTTTQQLAVFNGTVWSFWKP